MLKPSLLHETLAEEDEQQEQHESEDALYFCRLDPQDIEISYTQDEQALAYERAQYTILNENHKTDAKINSVALDTTIVNKGKREKGSPSMITRIFCNKLLSSNELTEGPNNLKKDNGGADADTLNDDECLSSTSIYDHIEAFTFDDFTTPVKSEVKQVYTKPKPRNANVNINKFKKPNFPGYSESFKQILDKKNLLNIHRTKIQKRLSRKGEQLNKMVRRSESRFLKDKNKLDPNMTYDRRNCKNDVVNQAMVGGDIYVSVVKQPVVEREASHHSGSYRNFNDLESVPDHVDGEIRQNVDQTIRLVVSAGTDCSSSSFHSCSNSVNGLVGLSDDHVFNTDRLHSSSGSNTADRKSHESDSCSKSWETANTEGDIDTPVNITTRVVNKKSVCSQIDKENNIRCELLTVV